MVSNVVRVMLQKMGSYEKMLIYCWQSTKMNDEGNVKLRNQKWASKLMIRYNLKKNDATSSVIL
jgi:hypothetical protein